MKSNKPAYKQGKDTLSLLEVLERIIGQRCQKFADLMNRKSAQWSAGKQKILLVFFCLLFGSAFVLIAFRAMVQTTGPPVSTTSSFPRLHQQGTTKNSIVNH